MTRRECCLTFWGTAKSSSTAQIPVSPYRCHTRDLSMSSRSCSFQNDWHPVGGVMDTEVDCDLDHITDIIAAGCLGFSAVWTAFTWGYVFCSWCVVCQCASSSWSWCWPKEESLTAVVRRGCRAIACTDCVFASEHWLLHYQKYPFPECTRRRDQVMSGKLKVDSKKTWKPDCMFSIKLQCLLCMGGSSKGLAFDTFVIWVQICWGIMAIERW